MKLYSGDGRGLTSLTLRSCETAATSCAGVNDAAQLNCMASPKCPPSVLRELGEHNDEVLQQLGFNTTEIDGLRASGAVPNPKGTPSSNVEAAKASG
jgi:hypothetical protein